jgi:hypothetical protein
VRASQTATELLDHSVADYLGIDRNADRCLDILDQEGPMTAGRLAERARASARARSRPWSTGSRKRESRAVPATRKTRRRVLVEVTPELPASRAALRDTRRRSKRACRLQRRAARVPDCGDLRPDVDLELALDVLGGPLFYRLLITGGPLDEQLAAGVTELILRGFAPDEPRRAKSKRTAKEDS